MLCPVQRLGPVGISAVFVRVSFLPCLVLSCISCSFLLLLLLLLPSCPFPPRHRRSLGSLGHRCSDHFHPVRPAGGVEQVCVACVRVIRPFLLSTALYRLSPASHRPIHATDGLTKLHGIQRFPPTTDDGARSDFLNHAPWSTCMFYVMFWKPPAERHARPPCLVRTGLSALRLLSAANCQPDTPVPYLQGNTSIGLDASRRRPDW